MSRRYRKGTEVEIFAGYIRIQMPNNDPVQNLTVRQTATLIKKLTESMDLLTIQQVMES